MPQKLALTPNNLKTKILALQEKYDPKILSWANNLYMYCFTEFHSIEINQARKGSHKIVHPFLSGGSREYPMIYTFLLSRLLKEYCHEYWDDAVLLIYITYYTGFYCDSIILESKKDFDWMVNTEEGLAKPTYKNAFKKVERYNFIKSNRGKYSIDFKRSLIERVSNFKKKFTDDELVERFERYSLGITRNGL